MSFRALVDSLVVFRTLDGRFLSDELAYHGVLTLLSPSTSVLLVLERPHSSTLTMARVCAEVTKLTKKKDIMNAAERATLRSLSSTLVSGVCIARMLLKLTIKEHKTRRNPSSRVPE